MAQATLKDLRNGVEFKYGDILSIDAKSCDPGPNVGLNKHDGDTVIGELIITYSNGYELKQDISENTRKLIEFNLKDL